MRKHQVNILLLKVIKGFAFRQDASNQFMSDFNAAFLIRGTGITIENKTAKLTIFILLDRDWVAELTATVRQNHGKELTIGFPPKSGIEAVEHLQNRAGGVAVTQEGKKQIAVLEEHGQKDFSALVSDNRVHLNDRNIRVIRNEAHKIFVSAAFIAVSVDFQPWSAPPRTYPDDAGTIHLVSSVEQTGVQIIVGGLFADHQHVCMIHKGMMDRLSVLDERRNNLIDVLQLQRVDCKPLPTLGEGSLIGSVRVVRLVLVLSQRASLFVLAVSADAGRFGELWAHFFNEVRAVLIAVLAVPAGPSTAKAGLADICFFAVSAMDTRVETASIGTFFNRDSMQSDFFGNGARVSVEFFGDLGKRNTLIDSGTDSATVLQCEVRMFGHRRILHSMRFPLLQTSSHH